MLFDTEVMPKYGQILCKLVPVLRIQASGYINHQFIKTRCKALMLIDRLQDEDKWLSCLAINLRIELLNHCLPHHHVYIHVQGAKLNVLSCYELNTEDIA